MLSIVEVLDAFHALSRVVLMLFPIGQAYLPIKAKGASKLKIELKTKEGEIRLYHREEE